MEQGTGDETAIAVVGVAGRMGRMLARAVIFEGAQAVAKQAGYGELKPA